MKLPIILFRFLKVYPYDQIVGIHDIKLVQTISNHAMLTLDAIVTEEIKDLYVAMTSIETMITVQSEGIGEEALVLFQGMVTHIKVKVVRDVYHLCIEAASMTYKLSLMNRSRSFQDAKMPISEIVKQVLAPYEGAGVIFYKNDTLTLYNFFLQFVQNDWDFLVMLASEFHTGIIASCESSTPKLYFGIMKNMPAVTLTETNYTTEKRILPADAGPSAYDGGYSMAYRVQSNMLLTMGQPVLFQGQTLYVESIDTHIEKGELVHGYSLTDAEGLQQKRIYNEKIVGTAMEAMVLAVQGTRVKLHLSIDEYQDKEKARWFEYASMYSSGIISGIYMMPEIGDRVRLYFADVHEAGCFVINSVNRLWPYYKERDESQFGLERDRWKDPAVKSIKAHGKEIILAPDRIIMQATDVSITWHDEDGVTITTKNNIKIRADELINISAAEIRVDGEEKVQITCGGSNINMTPGGVRIDGSDIKMG
ncbi:hypothetical protein [Anaerosinus massiliensis]|uniref:hypothetical protein n=1 Tax=Massilibacillus massiliensis TaxID=1806837 RepID=UPI000DA5FB39|nr:hypothetical protein [Massilibacillus massiliensis]